jgi:Legume-like lectin family
MAEHLRLTPGEPASYGGLFSSKPLPVDEWVIEVALKVHGRRGGRGLAIWYTKVGRVDVQNGKLDRPCCTTLFSRCL